MMVLVKWVAQNYVLASCRQVAEVAKNSCAEGTLTYAVSRCPKLQAPIGNYLRRPTQRPPWTTKKPVAAEVFKTASGNFKFFNEFSLLTYNSSC